MQILVLFAHPVEGRFQAGLHETIVSTLRAGGHDVDDCDLYAEGFDPVMDREERSDLVLWPAGNPQRIFRSSSHIGHRIRSP